MFWWYTLVQVLVTTVSGSVFEKGTCSSLWGNQYPPANAFDGNVNTIFHTNYTYGKYEWLKLWLKNPSPVIEVTVVNRYVLDN